MRLKTRSLEKAPPSPRAVGLKLSNCGDAGTGALNEVLQGHTAFVESVDRLQSLRLHNHLGQ